MRAELRRLHSPDVLDLEGFAPPIRDAFGILIQAMIGPEGSPGEEAFDFILCTPSWLAVQLGPGETMWLQEHMLIAEYNYAAVESAVKALCSGVVGGSWSEVALKLNRFARWEFADYRNSGSRG